MIELVPIYVLAALGFLLAAWGVKLAYDSKKEIRHAFNELKSFKDPSLLGDALHHAFSKNNYEVMEVGSEYLNGAVHDAIPTFTKALGAEAVGALGAIYGSGAAREMGKKSGAARAYTNLSGIGKQAVKQGAESFLGGALQDFLPDGVDLASLAPLAAQFLGKGGGNGQPFQLPSPQSQPQQQTNWRPPV